MDARLPLSTLLSHALVAFTIELDNEFEHQMPHRTTRGGPREGPWLVSLAMWSNCMRFVGEDGVRVGELEALARTPTNLNGMQRWGYVVVAPEPDDRRKQPSRSDWVIRATPAGRRAQAVWQPLFDVILTRWRGRFGTQLIDDLDEALQAVISQFDVELPECLPILGYGLYTRLSDRKPRAPAGTNPTAYSNPPLSVHLSQVLLKFALDFERESATSLAIAANLVRVLGNQEYRVRDLPRLAGVSQEAISVAIGFLQKRGVVVVETVSRVKVARLTPVGRAVCEAYPRLVARIEESWQVRYGSHAIGPLRQSLERLVDEPARLLSALEPYPDGWRASLPRPSTLPHFPMVLHRGGYPDGA